MMGPATGTGDSLSGWPYRRSDLIMMPAATGADVRAGDDIRRLVADAVTTKEPGTKMLFSDQHVERTDIEVGQAIHQKHIGM
jgi:hypothetical protein